MSTATEFVKAQVKAQKAKQLMLKGEKSGNWHKTKRAAALFDGRLKQIDDMKKGN